MLDIVSHREQIALRTFRHYYRNKQADSVLRQVFKGVPLETAGNAAFGAVMLPALDHALDKDRPFSEGLLAGSLMGGLGGGLGGIGANMSDMATTAARGKSLSPGAKLLSTLPGGAVGGILGILAAHKLVDGFSSSQVPQDK